MSIAVVPQSLHNSPTWRQFQFACIGVLLAVGIGSGIYAVETLILQCDHRFVENPAETMTRAIGLAHFSIGWLFLFTSPRLRNRAALARLAFWTLFGFAFCWIFAQFGADKNPFLMMAYFSFFFVHEVWDEAYLYRQSGESRDEASRAEQFVPALCWAMSLLLMAVLASFQVVRSRSVLLQYGSELGLIGAGAVLSMLAVGALIVAVRRARQLYGSVQEAVAQYRPLFAVYAGIGVIMLIGSLFGSSGVILIILIHGLTWLVCTYRRLSERRAEVTGIWSWLRGTPTGFLTLHLGLTVVALVLFALRTHIWQRTGIVCDLVSRSWFPYWSIMHIAVSFWRTK